MIIRSRKQTMIVPCIFIALSLAVASAFGDESALLRGKHLNRRLTSREVQFVNECSTELLIDTVLGDQMISQIEFTDTYFRLCTNFGLSGCSQEATFETLDEDIQFAFASEICHDKSSTCLKNLISLITANNEVGYVLSSQTAVVQNLVNNICVELEYVVLGDVSDGVDLVGVDSGPTVASSTGTNATNIVGAATAGSACLLLLYLVAGQRKNRQQNDRPIKDLESNNSYRTESSPDTGSSEGDMMVHLKAPFPANQSTSLSHFSPNMTSDADEVFEAIINADWYEVYNLASKLSECEDLSTISSFGRQDSLRSYAELDLSHLSLEDQQRTRTLDRLAKNRDWTGVAVTAALYADESMSSREKPIESSFFSNAAAAVTPETENQNILKERIDTAVDSGDWDKVLALSSDVEDTHTFDGELPTLLPQSDLLPDQTLLAARETLNEALFKGDWAVVGVYANKVREMKNQVADSDSSQPITVTEPLDIGSPEFSGSSDPDTIKNQTIAKLINEEKWKGVSIMAGLYDMESKGSLS